MKLTKRQYRALKETQRVLGGECKNIIRACPAFLDGIAWRCKDCDRMFEGLPRQKKQAHRETCPCQAFGPLAIQRLDEVIAKYEEDHTCPK